ncbi:MAG: NUDIX domain-containing protein [Candidatus Berkelbacteria bacterium]|nr:NUDIX domain-containing protein [Candidatus Berkelbacteria bacterium]
MNETTLCYLIRNGVQGLEVCLAEKKLRYVKGKLNAAGGHVEKGEDPAACAARELFEEQDVVVEPGKLCLQATIYFIFPGKEHVDLKCHVFVARGWEGCPKETSSMGAPEWYPVDNLPVDQLPGADADWLPTVIVGEEFIERTYRFDKDFKPLQSA